MASVHIRAAAVLVCRPCQRPGVRGWGGGGGVTGGGGWRVVLGQPRVGGGEAWVEALAWWGTVGSSEWRAGGLLADRRAVSLSVAFGWLKTHTERHTLTTLWKWHHFKTPFMSYGKGNSDLTDSCGYKMQVFVHLDKLRCPRKQLRNNCHKQCKGYLVWVHRGTVSVRAFPGRSHGCCLHLISICIWKPRKVDQLQHWTKYVRIREVQVQF